MTDRESNLTWCLRRGARSRSGGGALAPLGSRQCESDNHRAEPNTATAWQWRQVAARRRRPPATRMMVMITSGHLHRCHAMMT